MYILPYKNTSESANKLAQSLNCKLLKSNFSVAKSFTSPIINWGNSKRVITSFSRLLNRPSKVKYAVNKLKTFEILKANNINIPDFTTNYETAKEWINEGEWIVARSLLESSSGQGITLAKTIEELPTNSKLYVKYFKKTYEFRVHVFDGKVIDYIQKRKRNDVDESLYNKYVRSYTNGWVFCRDNIIENDNVKQLAIKAIQALKLDFGAVDIVMKSSGEAKVLEINCAPALEGTTLERYKEAIVNCDKE